MAKQPKMIMVRNTQKRVFNWVRPFQIVEIAEENLFMYKNAGFEVYSAKSKDVDDSADDAQGSDDIQARKDFLEAQGVKTGRRWDKRIISESDKLGFWEQEDNEVSEDDLADLDPETDEEEEEVTEEVEETEEVTEEVEEDDKE